MGSGRGLAQLAQHAAAWGESLLYLLVLLSLVRLMPYRYWRWTHKLMGIPFAFASWHFFTSEKPYANVSAWGWWFGVFMIAGIAAYLARVVIRDAVAPGVPYRVVGVEHTAMVTELVMEPAGQRALRHRPGQFAFIKLNQPGLREPHAFSIASPPTDRHLRFIIRDLGDWTRRLRTVELVGADVHVEGPYGRFRPLGARPRPTIWIAGGVGITPFLSAIDGIPSGDSAPHLFYAVRSREDAPGLDELEEAERQGRLHLHVYPSAEGRRLTPDELQAAFGEGGLAGHHVALCGPHGLVQVIEDKARGLGARRIHHEGFDMRRGVGPELD